VITKFADWPGWVQTVVVAPNALLAGIAFWVWWPKSDKEWRKFGFVMAYLVAFFLVMHFIFKF
jgi:hypothetical protein